MARDAETLALETCGQLRPRYELVTRPAVALAIGELAVEPYLGVLRVRDKQAEKDFVHITWADDHGPCTPAGRYPADEPFWVRTPALGDRLVIQRGIDQAARNRREVSPKVARLAAAHLQLGRSTALYRFAVYGTVSDKLFDELDYLHTHQRLYRSWIQALTRHCLAREDLGPVPSWQPDRSLLMSPHTEKAGRSKTTSNNRRGRRASRSQWAATQLRMELVAQLIDAAFDLGVTVAQAKSQKRGKRRATSAAEGRPVTINDQTHLP